MNGHPTASVDRYGRTLTTAEHLTAAVAATYPHFHDTCTFDAYLTHITSTTYPSSTTGIRGYLIADPAQPRTWVHPWPTGTGTVLRTAPWLPVTGIYLPQPTTTLTGDDLHNAVTSLNTRTIIHDGVALLTRH